MEASMVLELIGASPDEESRYRVAERFVRWLERRVQVEARALARRTM